MRNSFACVIACIMIFAVLASCSGGNKREAAITAALGPADAALPHQAVFAANIGMDSRLVSAAKNFCDRTYEFSNGGTVFSFVLSKNALVDLRAGNADAILLENASAPAFSLMSEAFRYKNHKHFSMAANSAVTLRRLSEMLGANVFAGFYAGSNVFLSRGTIDFIFKQSQHDTDESSGSGGISVTALEYATAYSFSLSGVNVTEEKALDERIKALAKAGSAVEFSLPELESPALLEAVRTINSGNDVEPVPDDNSGSASGGLAPLVLTSAFTGIKPVWLVFAPSAYDKLSQTGRAAVAEAAAYMTADIDGAYLEYERNQIEMLFDEDVSSSRDFAATRVQILRIARERALEAPGYDKKLSEAISRIQ